MKYLKKLASRLEAKNNPSRSIKPMRATASSPFKWNGIIESNKDAATKFWGEIIRKIGYHSFRLEPVTYGIAAEH